MSGGDIFSLISTLIGTIAVIVLTYYGSRWYVKRIASGQGSLSGGNHIKVVERLAVNKTGSIIIIDVQGVQYMVGVSDQNIQIMTQLEEPIGLPQKSEMTKESFLSIFKKVTQKENKNEKN
ncbi:MAG: FliO/MopB family protein [Acetobacterium sp.]